MSTSRARRLLTPGRRPPRLGRAAREREWELAPHALRAAAAGDKLLRESPSLGRHLPVLRDEAWPDAVRDAIAETGLRARTFPTACPFTLDQILDQDYLTEDES